MPALRFSALVELHGVNPFVLVSSERAAKLKRAWRRPMPVSIRVNGQPREPWRINMMPVGDGSFRLYLHGDVRKACGAKIGDRVKVEVSFDAAYKRGPEQPLPGWFRAALEKTPVAKANWGRLPRSRQKEIVRYLARLKSEAARARNLERALGALSGKPDRFLARSWG